MGQASCRFLVLVVALLLAGCTSSNPSPEVTGKITLNGAPLPGGKVTFVYADGKNSPMSIIQEDGRYNLVNLAEGDVKVAVEGPGRPSVVVKNAPPPVKVPAKYSKASSSGLDYKIIKGKQTKDFELRSP